MPRQHRLNHCLRPHSCDTLRRSASRRHGYFEACGVYNSLHQPHDLTVTKRGKHHMWRVDKATAWWQVGVVQDTGRGTRNISSPSQATQVAVMPQKLVQAGFSASSFGSVWFLPEGRSDFCQFV